MEVPEPKSNENIRVFCRVRPFNQKEIDLNTQNVFEFESDNSVNVDNKKFVFDKTFPAETNQEEMFKNVATNVNNDLINGINSAIFAYGQTSSGKTHTMQGDMGDVNSEGIIPRIIRDLFEKIEDQPEKYEFTIHVSFYEIYNNEAYDLLSSSGKKEKLEVLFAGGQPIIKKLQHAPIANMEQFFQWYDLGQTRRRVGATCMNAQSSRSHSILEILMSKRESNCIDNTVFDGNIYRSKVQLVDLAGSESVDKTGAKGERLSEASNINKSLSTLAIIISELAKGKTPEEIIHFRSSRLTMVCRTSLGGNSRTTIIICCSPSSFNKGETVNTLRFGNNASHIKSCISVNKELTIDEIKRKYNIVIMNFNKILNVKSELVKWRGGENVPLEEQIDISKFVIQSKLGVVASNRSVKRREKKHTADKIIASKSEYSLLKSKGYNSMVSMNEKEENDEMRRVNGIEKAAAYVENLGSDDGDRASTTAESVTTSTCMNDSGLDMSLVDRFELERLYSQNVAFKKENEINENKIDSMEKEMKRFKSLYENEIVVNREMLETYEKINNEYDYKSRMLDELVQQYHLKTAELNESTQSKEELESAKISLAEKLNEKSEHHSKEIKTMQSINKDIFSVVKNILLETLQVYPLITNCDNVQGVNTDSSSCNLETLNLNLLNQLKTCDIDHSSINRFIDCGTGIIRKMKNVTCTVMRDNERSKQTNVNLEKEISRIKADLEAFKENHKILSINHIDVTEQLEKMKSKNESLAENMIKRNKSIKGIILKENENDKNENDLDYQLSKLLDIRKDNESKTGKIAHLNKKIIEIEDVCDRLKNETETMKKTIQSQGVEISDYKTYLEYNSRLLKSRRPVEDKNRILLQKLLKTRQQFVNDIFERISNNVFKANSSQSQLPDYENVAGSFTLVARIKSDNVILDDLSKKCCSIDEENNKLKSELSVQNQQVTDLEERIVELEKRNNNLSTVFHSKAKELISVKKSFEKQRKKNDCSVLSNVSIPLRGGRRQP